MLKEVIGKPAAGFVLVRREIVALTQNHPLVRAIYRGNQKAMTVYLRRFWPFVAAFERIIDEQSRRHGRAVARAIGDIALFREIRVHLREMKKEEGEHAGLWHRSAQSAGVNLDDSGACPQVERLIARMRDASPDTLFIALWVTEVIANAISEKAMKSRALARFDREWFRVHTALEELSHEAIDRFIITRMLGDKLHDCFREEALEVFDLFAAAADAAWPH